MDHRTLDEQQHEAEQKGDTFLSKVNLRVAEEYIGNPKSHSNNTFIVDLKKTRERNFQCLQSYFQEDIKQTAGKEYEVREKIKQAEVAARRFPSNFTTEVGELNELKRRFTTTREILENGKSARRIPNAQ